MQRLMLVGLIALGTLISCTSTQAEDPSAKTVQSMERLQKELRNSKVDINSAVAILNQLGSENTQLTQQFKSLTTKITLLEDKAKIVRGMRQDMDKAEEEFLAQWGAKLNRIASDDLREQATDRRDETKAMFDELQERCDTARGTFDPWIRQLNDVRKFLEPDLSQSAVSSLGDVIKSINEGAPKLQSEIDSIDEQITKVVNSIAATKEAAGEPS